MTNAKGISIVCFSAILAVVILTPMINPVLGYIEEWIWAPPYEFKRYDYDFYVGYIVAYLDDETVTLLVPVKNNVDSTFNVTAVSIVFDWGLNVTLDYTSDPFHIDYDDIHYFEISFTADLDEATNVYGHTYDIYVKYEVYWTNGTWSESWNSYVTSPDYKFVVFSQDQEDVIALRGQYNAFMSAYPPYYFQTTEGRLKATRASASAEEGRMAFEGGNFAEARSHYQTAVDLYDAAFASEQDLGTAMEEAELNATAKQANAVEKQADAAMLQAQAVLNQSIGYILFGLGFILMGIGAIFYGARKPKTP